MIGRLSGQLVEKQPSRLIINVQGVGYEVQVPLSTFYGLGDTGTEISLRVHTHVREDTLSLFGFATELELQLFEHLISISGVGPRLALAVLSGIEPPDLVRAIRDADVARLTRIPGIGKKTAQRVGLELKDKFPRNLDAEIKDNKIESEFDGSRGDVLSALLNLGYHRTLAERAVERAFESAEGGFESTLRQALRELSK